MNETRNRTTPPTTAAHTPVTAREGDFVSCPECGAPAIVEWSSSVGTTDAPLEHLKIRCVQKHWFLLPAYLVPGAGAAAA
ncbi:MAG: hypothetical protein ABWZ91_12615 [Nocardioides sp.]